MLRRMGYKKGITKNHCFSHWCGTAKQCIKGKSARCTVLTDVDICKKKNDNANVSGTQGVNKEKQINKEILRDECGLSGTHLS